ncbi:unnamed protein product [Gadus morhua 'NCC']
MWQYGMRLRTAHALGINQTGQSRRAEEPHWPWPKGRHARHFPWPKGRVDGEHGEWRSAGEAPQLVTYRPAAALMVGLRLAQATQRDTCCSGRPRGARSNDAVKNTESSSTPRALGGFDLRPPFPELRPQPTPGSEGAHAAAA